MKAVVDAALRRSSALATKSESIAWTVVWIVAIGLACSIHLAFLVAWPDHFVHEDSAAYLYQAQSILTGHYVDDVNQRPYGLAIFLVLLSKVFSPNILVFVTAQHVLSITTALLIAIIVRFSGASRFFSILAFLLSALYARTVHYDNTIGAETLSVFLTTVAAFVASGIVLRNWPPLVSALGVGLSLGAMLICRSAGVAPAFIILLWLAIFANARPLRRLGSVVLAGLVMVAVASIPGAINRMIGKPPAATENLAVMSFLVGYSADFDHGVHLDRKAQARFFVQERRAEDSPTGWADTDKYQWPLDAVALMKRENESKADFERIVQDIFIETLTTPSTLWRHLTRHVAREMYFMLFDGNIVARRVSSPAGYEFFGQREPFPIFGSPTGLKSGRLVYDMYAPPRALAWLLSSPDALQSYLDSLFRLGYAPVYNPVPFCCGLRISGEYDTSPGPIRWLSGATLLLLTMLLARNFKDRSGWLPKPRSGVVAGGALMIGLGLVNTAFPAFLVYGLHRYAYYVTPFLAGATSIFGAILMDQMKPILAMRPTAPTRNENGSERAMPQENQDISRSPLQIFFAKVAIVTGAFLISVYYVSSVTSSFATSQMDRIASEIDRLGLKDGPAFWGSMETRLYALANAPDLPAERKQKIIEAIHKLSAKYKPYVDAFNQDNPPAKPDQLQVRQ